MQITVIIFLTLITLFELKIYKSNIKSLKSYIGYYKFIKSNKNIVEIEKEIGKDNPIRIIYYRPITRKEYYKQTNESCLIEKQRESKNLNQK